MTRLAVVAGSVSPLDAGALPMDRKDAQVEPGYW